MTEPKALLTFISRVPNFSQKMPEGIIALQGSRVVFLGVGAGAVLVEIFQLLSTNGTALSLLSQLFVTLTNKLCNRNAPGKQQFPIWNPADDRKGSPVLVTRCISVEASPQRPPNGDFVGAIPCGRPLQSTKWGIADRKEKTPANLLIHRGFLM